MDLNSSTLVAKDGEYTDWIELYNVTPIDINLSGWSLTDDQNQSRKWIFPDVVIESTAYLVLFASEKNWTNPDQELHTNFKLDGNGEYCNKVFRVISIDAKYAYQSASLLRK